MKCSNCCPSRERRDIPVHFQPHSSLTAVGPVDFPLRRKTLKGEHLSTPSLMLRCSALLSASLWPPSRPHLRLFPLLLSETSNGTHQLLPFWVISRSKAVFSHPLNDSRTNACVQSPPYPPAHPPACPPSSHRPPSF